MKNFVCICCPRGCSLSVDEQYNVTGNFCLRGKNYAISELTHPTRIVTSTILVNNRDNCVTSVKTDKPVPKEFIFKVMDEINKKSITAPCHIGDIVISNVLNTDINIIVTKEIN